VVGEMIYLLCFVISWLIFYFLADKFRIGEYLPSMIFAGFLAIITDIMMIYNEIWSYHKYWPLPEWAVAFSLDIGVYAVVSALFIQWLPKSRILQLLYIIPWTAGAIAFEFLFLQMDWIKHHQHYWTLMHSYIADWIIFYLIIVQYDFYSKRPTST
jgi:hypothetical protein